VVIGRSDERRAIVAFLEGAEAGPVALVLEGEPGIGKTTLFLDAVEQAELRNVRALVARPAETESGLPFSVLADLFDPMLLDADGELPEPQMRSLRAALLRETISSPVDRSALCAGALALVRRSTRDRGLLVAIDDAQWIDPDSAGVIAFLIRRLTAEPVGALFARRSDPSSFLARDLEDAIGRLPGRSLALPPVSEEDIGSILIEQLGAAVPRAEIRQIHQLSAGNPFYALELARAIRRGDDRPTGMAIPIPRSLREDLVRQRLDFLSDDTRQVLVAAAALARPTTTLLKTIVGGDVDEALEPASRAGVVKVTTEAVTFTHPLFRSALYADTSRAERHRLHAAIAEIVRDPEERARHLGLSADGPDRVIAGSIEEGADHARERGALSSAADLYAHSVRLTPPEDLEGIARRSRAAGEVRSRIGDPVGGIGDVRRAVDLTGPGAARAAALESLGSLERESGRLVEARRHLEEALIGSGDDRTLRCRIHAALSRTLLEIGDLDGARTSGAQAAELAAGLDDPVASRADGAWLAVSLASGDLSPLEPIRSRWEGSDSRWDARVEVGLGRVLTWIGELEAARGILEDLQTAAIAHGDEIARRSILTDLADVDRRRGRWVEGLERITEADRIASDAGTPPSDPGLRIWMEAALGREVADADVDGEPPGSVDTSGLLEVRTLAAWGMLALSRGDPSEAHRYLAPACERFLSVGIQEPGWEPFHGDAVEAFLADGDHRSAEGLTAWLEDRADALDRTETRALADRCRGLVSAARGDREDADLRFRRAVDGHAIAGARYELARTLLVQGSWLRRTGRKRDARDALDRASTWFRELGAPLWADRAKAETMRIGGRRPSKGALTEAERRVARLAAAGRSNREIADTLVTSVRTVEGHLSSAYAKLGVRNRTELALFFDGEDAASRG
jgi:DNA-binding CsgD family transcriptional regulator